MPAGDRTGPQGDGPMTGRGLGRCSDGIQVNRSDGDPARPRRYMAYRRGAGNGSRGAGRKINGRRSGGIFGRGRN